MTPLVVGAVLLLAGALAALLVPRNSLRIAVSLVSQTLAAASVLSVALPTLLQGSELRDVFQWSYPIDRIAVHLDPLGAFFLVWSLPMVLAGSVYAAGYLRPYFHSRNLGFHFALLNLVSLSFVIVYTVENSMVFLLGWEIAAVTAWLLVIFDYTSQKVRFAGFNYLISTHLGLLFLVAGLMILHSQTGSMDFQSFSEFLSRPGPLRNTTFVLLVTAFGLKSAFFPFHTWLPRAHAAAPAHVSALMSGVIHKAGLFGLLRFTLLLKHPAPWMGWCLIGVSLMSAVVGALYTTSQRDLKRLLGYSSTENVGIAGVGFGIGYLGLSWNQPLLVALGFTGGILHILNHALFKCLLFYAAGAIYRATHSVDLERLGGLLRSMPWTAAFFLLGGLAMVGMPGFNGFSSEFLIAAGALDPSTSGGFDRVWLIATAAGLALVGGVSALAMTRAFGLTFLGAPRDASVARQGEVGRPMLLTMAVHLLLVVAIGLAPELALRLVSAPAGLFRALVPGPAAVFDPALALAGPSRLIALVIVTLAGLWAVRWWLGRKTVTLPEATWGCGYHAPNPRMQYTGASFAAPLVRLVEGVLPQLRRERLPKGFFPARGDHLSTHSVDAVERRLFELLGNSDDLIVQAGEKVPEESRLAFGIGLLVLVVTVGLLFAGRLGLE